MPYSLLSYPRRAHRVLAILLSLSALSACAIETTPASDDGDDGAEVPATGDTPRGSRTPASTTSDDGESDGLGRAAFEGDAGAAPSVDAGRAVRVDAGLSRDAGRTGPSTRPAADAGLDGGAPPAASDELESLRQLCVDEINRYRASVNAPPLARATDREECSDKGAALDGDTGRAHGSGSAGGAAGKDGYCPRSAQNTCPDWGVGGRSGNPTVAAALKGCLKMMWNEGPPPSGSCSGACFQAHGHYLNMSAPATKRVACGFYKMKNGNYWMNQNFW